MIMIISHFLPTYLNPAPLLSNF